jgi:hypothetical protein
MAMLKSRNREKTTQKAEQSFEPFSPSNREQEDDLRGLVKVLRPKKVDGLISILFVYFSIMSLISLLPSREPPPASETLITMRATRIVQRYRLFTRLLRLLTVRKRGVRRVLILQYTVHPLG